MHIFVNNSGASQVNKDQLATVASHFGVDPAAVDSFEGQMDTQVFIQSLRGELSARHTAFLEKIWGILDPAELGNI